MVGDVNPKPQCSPRHTSYDAGRLKDEESHVVGDLARVCECILK